MSRHQTVLCRYHYDPLDRLAGHATASESGIRLFYQRSRLATQIQGTLHRSILQFDDQLLAQQQSSGKAVETALLATDQQRSVLQSIGASQREASAYTAYGHLPMSSGLSRLLGFDGERRDPLTGHYLLGNGYRAFNPVLMRFNSPDSLSPFGKGGVNAYAYCQGDPVNHRDPTGHISGPYYGLIKILDPFTDSVKWLRGVKVAPTRPALALPVGGTPSGVTAVLPRPIETINVGEGLSFNFHSEASRRSLSSEEYLENIQQNFEAFNSFDTRHDVQINQALAQLEEMSSYLNLSVREMPPGSIPQEYRQGFADHSLRYRDNIRRIREAFVRR